MYVREKDTTILSLRQREGYYDTESTSERRILTSERRILRYVREKDTTIPILRQREGYYDTESTPERRILYDTESTSERRILRY